MDGRMDGQTNWRTDQQKGWVTSLFQHPLMLYCIAANNGDRSNYMDEIFNEETVHGIKQDIKSFVFSWVRMHKLGLEQIKQEQ